MFPHSAFFCPRQLSPADAEKVLLLFRLSRDASPSLSRLSRDEIAEAVITGKLPGRWRDKAVYLIMCNRTRFSLLLGTLHQDKCKLLFANPPPCPNSCLVVCS